MIDHERLVRLFGGPEMEPLLVRLRRRLELGRTLTGTIVLTDLSTSQLDAISGLLGRTPAGNSDRSISVPLDALGERLADAKLCDSLRAAVELLTGPVANTRDLRAQADARWVEVFASAPAPLRDPPFSVCLQRWRETGSLKRLTHNSPAAARESLARVATVADALPAGGQTLAQFAATLFGNAHALDFGEPTATLALQLVAAYTGLPAAEDTESRRELWAAAGVLCDDLSAPALALNLPVTGDGLSARLLREAAAAGEPLYLSLRTLLRYPLACDAGLAGRSIFVCENATIVALAAERLGPRCAPLVGVQGQYATPSRILLRQLCAAGARLRFHGDFDAGGLGIARRVFDEFHAEPWRFGAADYASAPKGEDAEGSLGSSPWDPALASAMRTDGRIVHEEVVFDLLVADLSVGRESS